MLVLILAVLAGHAPDVVNPIRYYARPPGLTEIAADENLSIQNPLKAAQALAFDDTGVHVARVLLRGKEIESDIEEEVQKRRRLQPLSRYLRERFEEESSRHDSEEKIR